MKVVIFNEKQDVIDIISLKEYEKNLESPSYCLKKKKEFAVITDCIVYEFLR